MTELLDFFDAMRKVAGTNRWVRYKNDCPVRFNVVPIECTLELRDKENKRMPWPLLDTQKEKAWKVQPKEQELVDFPEAFAAALKGDLIEIAGGKNWSYYKAGYSGRGVAYLLDQNLIRWWPTPEQIAGKWQIKEK